MVASASQELQPVHRAGRRRATCGRADADRTPSAASCRAWSSRPRTRPRSPRCSSAATARGLAVVARGGGTKLDWGSPPERCDVVLSTVPHRRASSTTSPQTSSAWCGRGRRSRFFRRPSPQPRDSASASCSIHPTERAATIGGVVATAASGPLRTRFGTPRDLVIGASFVLSDGTVGTQRRQGREERRGLRRRQVARRFARDARGHHRGGFPPPSRCRAASRTVVLESRSVDRAVRLRRAVGRLQVTPSVVDLHWPQGVVARAVRQLGARRRGPGRARGARLGGRILAER